MLFRCVSVFYGWVIVHSVLVSADVFDATFDIRPKESKYARCRAEHGSNITVNIGDTLRVSAENDFYINMFECFVKQNKILSEYNNSSRRRTESNQESVLGLHHTNLLFQIFKETKISESSIGSWTCNFFTFKDMSGFHNITVRNGVSYMDTRCQFDVTLNKTSKNDTQILNPIGGIDKNTLIYIGVGTLVGTIFVVQTGVIIYFKTKASRIARLERLSSNRPETGAHSDNKRYCLTPGQRVNKLSRFLRRKNSKDDNEVYETLEDVQLNALNLTTPPIEAVPKMPSAIRAKVQTPVASQSPPTRKRSPIPPPTTADPPEPPRISTIPRRHANGNLEKDISNRPPLPLPTDPDQANQNTIERVPRKMPDIKRPTVSPMMDAVTAEMKLSTQLKPSLQRVLPLPIKDHQPAAPPIVQLPPKPKPAPPATNNSLPRVPNKPVVTPKPALEKPGPIAPVVSELDNVFKKRHNVAPTATADVPPLATKPFSTLNLQKKPPATPSTNNSLPRFPKKPAIHKPAQEIPVPVALPPKPVPPKPQPYSQEKTRQPPVNPVKPILKPAINKPGPVPPPSTSKVAKPPMLSPPPSHAPQFQLPNPVLCKPTPPPPTEEIYEEYLEEEEHIYNESADPIYNSDEEWTYEALPQYNIYSR